MAKKEYVMLMYKAIYIAEIAKYTVIWYNDTSWLDKLLHGYGSLTGNWPVVVLTLCLILDIN